jgi:hypothetical protein
MVLDRVGDANDHPENAAPRTSETDTQIALQLCLEIATGRKILTATDVLDSPTPGQQIIEYRRPVDSVTILGEVIGNHRGRRPIRFVVSDKDASASSGSNRPKDQNFIARESAIAGLDDEAVKFLISEKVFQIPPRDIW